MNSDGNRNNPASTVKPKTAMMAVATHSSFSPTLTLKTKTAIMVSAMYSSLVLCS